MSLDLVVVGAGPAGVSGALWARELDLTVRVIEARHRPGGQLHAIHFAPRDWAGIAAADGPAVAAVMARQLAERGVEVRYGDAAAALEPAAGGGPVAVRAADGTRHEARAVLVASGLTRRRLDVPGERELEGRGISTSATRDRARLAGRTVVVVGGGDAAFENALILAAAGCRVTLAVRDRPQAREEFRARVAAEPRITVLEGVRVTAFLGDEVLRAVRLATPAGDRTLDVEGAVVKVGAVPNTAWCAPVLARDADGYLRVDQRLRASLPGVWAAGDVTRPTLPSLSVAVGHGALAVADVRAALRGPRDGPPPAGRAGRD
jgi:thioredoxin reductase (NADPH)